MAFVLVVSVAHADEVTTTRTHHVAPPRPDDAPGRGPREALVTAELFCNFAHVQCASAERLLRRMLDRYPDGLRVVYRQVVLPFRDSQAVAEGSIEAFVQGRFLELADAAAARGTPLRLRELEAVAGRAGIDVQALRSALEDHRHVRRLEEDSMRRELLGVGSLGIAWNGEPSADLSLEAMERSYARARELAARRLGEGVPRERIHGLLVRDAIAARARAVAEGSRRRVADAEAPRTRISAGNAPTRGASDAAVTIVVYTDFECAYCRREEELLARLLALYPDRLRLVYKHFPLAQHGGARAAAEAAECARAQGRFWELHQTLFSSSGRIRAAELDRLIAAAGVDASRLRADLARGACAAAVDADLAEGRALGVESTPTLFVNGMKLVGLRSLAELRALVEDETAPGVLGRLLAP